MKESKRKVIGKYFRITRIFIKGIQTTISYKITKLAVPYINTFLSEPKSIHWTAGSFDLECTENRIILLEKEASQQLHRKEI